jgi:hypothetical protein
MGDIAESALSSAVGGRSISMSLCRRALCSCCTLAWFSDCIFSICREDEKPWATESKRDSKADSREPVSDILEIEPSSMAVGAEVKEAVKGVWIVEVGNNILVVVLKAEEAAVEDI